MISSFNKELIFLQKIGSEINYLKFNEQVIVYKDLLVLLLQLSIAVETFSLQVYRF